MPSIIIAHKQEYLTFKITNIVDLHVHNLEVVADSVAYTLQSKI